MGRILAIDFGKKRTGIAITDELQIIASGLTTVNTVELIAFLKNYISKEKVARFIVGKPKQMDNTDSESEVLILPFLEKLSKEIEAARKESDELKENLDSTQKENNKFRRIVLQLKDKLDEVTVSNARLLYTNRVLGDDSLNERQKSKIVETISKAQTIEEAKMIYGTLQSAVDGSTSQNKPKSLNEAVSRQSTMLFSRQARSGRATSDPALERMQRLAGITKN